MHENNKEIYDTKYFAQHVVGRTSNSVKSHRNCKSHSYELYNYFNVCMYTHMFRLICRGSSYFPYIWVISLQILCALHFQIIQTHQANKKGAQMSKKQIFRKTLDKGSDHLWQSTYKSHKINQNSEAQQRHMHIRVPPIRIIGYGYRQQQLVTVDKSKQMLIS